MNNKIVTSFLLFALFFAIIIITDRQNKSNKIYNWANQNGYQVKEIQETYLTQGPFEPQEGEKVYRVVVDSNSGQKIFWIKIFGNKLIQRWEQ